MTSRRDLPEGEVTFVLTDIEGSTTLLRRHGDAYDHIIERHHAIIRRHLIGRGGVEFRAAGDGFIFVFTDPKDALSAAIDTQVALTTHRSWPDGAEVRVRIGLHGGEARLTDGDYVSLALHQAVRVCAAANGGQVVASSGLAGAIDSADPFVRLESLGFCFVRDFEDAVELFEVRHPDIPAASAPPRVPSAAIHNLPPQRTTFVGRSVEVGDVGKMLDVASLVTLVGPGGVGKTRLATEAALTRAGDYAAGVWFVSLLGAGTDAEVASVIEQALGATDRGRPALDAVADHVGDQELLIVLDNCEHVVDGTAESVDDLLIRCPNLRVLATSREPVGLSAEHVYRVDPLALPSQDALVTDIAECGSVALFVQRAKQAHRSFELDASSAPTVGAICRALDGMPLALELAAARMSAAGLEDLRADLERSGLLDVQRRGGPLHQRSLRDAIGWSYNRLSPREQEVFRCLAPFRGFTVDAIRAVVGTEEVPAVLSELVLRSLVEPQPDTDPPRFRLLEPVRHFAADRLDVEGDARAINVAFIRWCADSTEATQQMYESGTQQESLERIASEYDNIRTAFATATTRGYDDLAGRLARASLTYCFVRGFWREALERCERALLGDLEDDLRADVLISLAHLLTGLGEMDEARKQLATCAEIYERTGNAYGIASCVTAEASAAMESGDRPAAIRLYRRGVDAYRSIGHVAGEARCLGDLGVLFMREDRGEARRLLSASLALQEGTGHDVGTAGSYNLLGQLAYLEDDLDEAEELFTKGLETAERIGLVTVVAVTTRWLGSIALARGDLDRAESLGRSALMMLTEVGETYQAALVSVDLGRVLLARGKPDEALLMTQDALRSAKARARDVVAVTVMSIARILEQAGSVETAARIAVALEAEGERTGRPVVTQTDVLDGLLTAVEEKLGPERIPLLRRQPPTLDDAIELALVATVNE